MLSQKKNKLFPPYPPHLSPHYLVKCKAFTSDCRCSGPEVLFKTCVAMKFVDDDDDDDVAFVQMLVTLKRASLWVGIGGFEND